MSRNIPKVREWRVTFIERANPGNTDTFYTLAPTKQLALWNAREWHHGAFMLPHPDYAERVGIVRKPR